jgi:hypothetical protein
MTKLTLKIEGAEIVRKGLENLSAEVPKVSRRRIYNTMLKIRTRMRQPGKAINYPVKWDSEKQRRAFFATNGFGRGIPSRRTNRYTSGWNIQQAGAVGYRIENNAPYSKYVGGTAYSTSQSNIHQGRWPILRDVFDEEVKKLPAEIEEEIKVVSRRGGLK